MFLTGGANSRIQFGPSGVGSGILRQSGTKCSIRRFDAEATRQICFGNGLDRLPTVTRKHRRENRRHSAPVGNPSAKSGGFRYNRWSETKTPDERSGKKTDCVSTEKTVGGVPPGRSEEH